MPSPAQTRPTRQPIPNPAFLCVSLVKAAAAEACRCSLLTAASLLLLLLLNLNLNLNLPFCLQLFMQQKFRGALDAVWVVGLEQEVTKVADTFFRTLLDVLNYVMAGGVYIPVTIAMARKGAPPPGWMEKVSFTTGRAGHSAGAHVACRALAAAASLAAPCFIVPQSKASLGHL